MSFNDFWYEIVSYSETISFWELSGLVFGILTVVFLIKESIWTWPFGIVYVITAFVVFWEAKLYGDFLLHIFFLVLNIYGWYYWVYGKKKAERELTVTKMSKSGLLKSLGISVVGVFAFAQLLIRIPSLFEEMEPAALPYWDSTTSILSVTAMWLTARKKIDNWYFWLVINVLATGIYFYKELYFFSLLYFLYIGMAIMGYMAWKKTMLQTNKVA
jgi:nicotinamide mononucleotide transporter